MRNSIYHNVTLEQISHIATKLMAKASIIAKDIRCQHILRGGNNQAFRVDSKQGTFF